MALAQLAEHSHDRPDRHYRRRRALAQLAAPLPEPPILSLLSSFFFQAEDGIRDWSVTGVQTCALPIWDVVRLAVGYDALIADDVAIHPLAARVVNIRPQRRPGSKCAAPHHIGLDQRPGQIGRAHV